MPVDDRVCASPDCDNSLAGKRVDAVYCSPTCRTLAADVRAGRRAYETQEPRFQIPPRLPYAFAAVAYGILLGIAAFS